VSCLRSQNPPRSSILNISCHPHPKIPLFRKKQISKNYVPENFKNISETFENSYFRKLSKFILYKK
jgi:hypothetical protein